ncbi:MULTISPECIES: hypothetical protein [unclassified Wolbachia]|uniref:hypothetical protein n=1 Tax=unclassified Wolbachia TaxID=2640676 RepID=UPI002232AA77|nr:hypothetical protein [Wolbachia endosymbiont (group A) of Macropis europaea]
MPGFFEKYKSFEEQVNAAIDADDAELVQVLLGPKYCQLWQYWLVHGIVTSKVLNMERIVNSKLFLSIIGKQVRVLEGQKDLLEKQQKLLESKDEQNTQGLNQGGNQQIKKSRHFVRDLLVAIRDAAIECRNGIVEESNKEVDYRSFYVPDNLLKNSNTQGDTIDQLDDLNCAIQQISTISSAERLSLTKEIDGVISEVSNQIESEIWGESDISTRVSYYLGKVVHGVENAVSGENGQLLDQALGTVPNNVRVRGTLLPFGAIASGIVTVLRYIPAPLLKLQESVYDNVNSSACVKNNLEEIERFIHKIENIAKEKQDLSDRLVATRNKIESQVVERMNDGKFIDKKFVRDMYGAFLYNYLDGASGKRSNLLYHDIEMENGNIKIVADKILGKVNAVDYEKFENFLNRALKKSNPNFDVISVLIVNSAPLFSYKCTDPNVNRNVERLMKRSFHTIMIDVHNLLFNFERHFPDIDVDVSLVSFLPNKDGSYTQSCKNNIILEGNERYKEMIGKVSKFMDEVEKLVEVGGLNRVRGFLGIPSLWYTFYDFTKGLFVGHTPSSTEEGKIIDEKIREFLCKATHSIAVGNEGMMKEYIEDARERMKHEKNSDVYELYKIVTDKRWRDIFRVLSRTKSEKEKYIWKDTPNEQKLDNFIKITDQRIRAFKNLEERSKARAAEEGKKQAEQMVKQEAQRAEQLKQALEQKDLENKVMKSCVKKLARFDEELQSAIDEESEDKIVKEAIGCRIRSPEEVIDAIIEEIKVNREKIIKEGRVSDEIIEASVRSFSNQGTSLSDVNISQGVNAGMGRN